MKKYVVLSPFTITGRLIMAEDVLFGEQIGSNVYLYDPKTRKKLGYTSLQKLTDNATVQ